MFGNGRHGDSLFGIAPASHLRLVNRIDTEMPQNSMTGTREDQR
jgi:hypothetical protein